MELLKIITLVLVLIVVDHLATARSIMANCEVTEVAKCVDNPKNRVIPILDDIVTVLFCN